ncbi:transglutaminase-like protein [Vitreoscilla sp. C1]|nr:transglutaminase family protein [Vitreoscilla sp. C1]AUZ04028.2 transglutaminase-like protein [Vitreoscilla sp. C1]
MNIHIHHQTTYFYDDISKKSIQLLRMTPQNLDHQKVLDWQLTLPVYSERGFDGFNNVYNLLTYQDPHQELKILAEGEVIIAMGNEYQIDEHLPASVYLRQTELTEPSAALLSFAQAYQSGDLTALKALSQDILKQIPYQKGITHVGTTAQEAFLGLGGVCQDHTHIFLSCTRALGIPSRYVSGYLYSEDQEHLASHAWAEAYVDGKWYLFDISNQHTAIHGHVQLAVGRDYNDAAPIRGMRQGGGMERMEYSVHVRTNPQYPAQQQQQQ